MAEPILWANKVARQRIRQAKQYNRETDTLEPIVDEETGEPVMEQVPLRGHSGEVLDPIRQQVPLVRLPRWVHFLKHCGTEARVPITNCAGQADPDTKYRKFIEAKAKHFGWIPVGTCPIAMVYEGKLRPNQIVAKGLLKISKDGKVTATPTEYGAYSELKPAETYIIERDARRERKRKVQAKRDKQFQGDVEKQLEAQRQQTSEIASAVATAVAKATKGGK